MTGEITIKEKEETSDSYWGLLKAFFYGYILLIGSGLIIHIIGSHISKPDLGADFILYATFGWISVTFILLGILEFLRWNTIRNRNK